MANFSPNFKSVKNLKLANQKQLTVIYLVIFTWLIFNFWQILNLKFGDQYQNLSKKEKNSSIHLNLYENFIFYSGRVSHTTWIIFTYFYLWFQ